MFVLTIEQKNYNRVKFQFPYVNDAAIFINSCMTFDGGKTAYKLEYIPEEEKEGEEQWNSEH